MTQKIFIPVFKAGAAILLLVALLAGKELLNSTSGAASAIGAQLAGIFRDLDTQWLVFLGLGMNFLVLVYFRFQGNSTNFWRAINPSMWLTGVLLASAISYAIKYSISTDALILLGGAAAGQGMALWAGGRKTGRDENSSAAWIPQLMVILLAAASLMNSEIGRAYEYRGQARWTGPWDNPNTFGLLMAAGMLLAIGMAVGAARRNQTNPANVSKWRYLPPVIMGSAAVVMGRGLFHSYSRGAWLAAFCGLAYLGWKTFPRFRRSAVPAGIIALSVAVLVFWQFQHTEKLVVRRAVSAGNANDFSWRNRVSTWEGVLQMMVDGPCVGFGWNRPGPKYEQYYRPVKVTEAAAIQTNDYLMLGATLGLPALGCFIAYFWLALKRKTESQKRDWLQTAGRAGVIVLLVGFWFDSALFKLAPASVFWILLEMA